MGQQREKKETGKRARRIKPWAATALAIALALLGYYALLGFQLLNYHAAEGALSAEANRLSGILRRPATDVGPLQAQLQDAQQKLKETSALYTYGQRDHLVSQVAEIARDAGVGLAQVAVAETGTESVGDVRYAVQSLDLWVSGSLGQILSFLNLLHQRAPTVAIAKVGLRSLQEKPAAEVRIVLYHSPEYVVKKVAKK